MASSKGLGVAAHEIAEVVPPEQLRLLFVRPRPNHALEFDPDGTDAIPRLFDESDRIAAATAGRAVKGELPPDHDRIFAASLVDPAADPIAAGAAYRPPFAHLALLLQIPGVDVRARLEAEKGEPLTNAEVLLLDERGRAARGWLDGYAPDKARIEVRREALPAAAADLAAAQRLALTNLAGTLAGATAWDGESLQSAIFDAARSADLPAGQVFAALYLAFLGQPHGPRAGWLLASLEPDFVVERLRAAAAPDTLTP
jgi:lysyl-tRNA synthetase class 1